MRFALQTIAGAAISVAAGSAQAAVDYVDLRINGIHVNDGKVVVEPVGNRYAKLATPEVHYNVEMKAGCKGLNKTLETTFVAFGNANMHGSVVEANPGMATVPVSARGNKEIGYTPALLKVSSAQLGAALNPVQMCNAWLDQRLAQGSSLQQIWTQAHEIKRAVTLSAVASCAANTGKPDYATDTLAHQLTVVCKPGAVGGGVGGIQAQPAQPPQVPGQFAKPMEVTALELRALPAQVTAACPAKLRFQAMVTADAAGSVQYQVRFPGNANTPPQSFGGQLVFDAAGQRTTPPIEFNANSGYPVGVAVLELVSAGGKKAQADFKLQCVQAQGPGQIQMAPMPGMNPPGQLQAPRPGASAPGARR